MSQERKTYVSSHFTHTSFPNQGESETEESSPIGLNVPITRFCKDVPVVCGECGSLEVWKDGFRRLSDSSIVQRFLCRKCGFRFILRHNTSKDSIAYGSDGQVCAILQEAKNLSNATETKTVAGEKAEFQKNSNGEILTFHIWLLKQGYNEGTAKNRAYLINRLVILGADIKDTETVKEILARKGWSDGYKANFVEAYHSFLQWQGKTWNPPRYRRPQKLSFIPTETEIDQLIAAVGKTTGAFLQGLKDTGVDPGELARAKWTDINKEAKTININRPVKGHNARILRVSETFLNRISLLPKKHDRIFNCTRMSATFWSQRKRIAQKLQNPRILQIHYTTFRHWKATIEYHRTKDLIYVQKLLGHKSIQSTMIYIDYEAALFGSATNEEFTVKVALNVEEACKLSEVGFEYVTGDYADGGKIFRKRK